MIKQIKLKNVAKAIRKTNKKKQNKISKIDTSMAEAFKIANYKDKLKQNLIELGYKKGKDGKWIIE